MASSKLSLKFRIFKGNELVGFRELNQAVIKIGKVPTAHVCIEDESVSRMHAIIEVGDTVAHIIDLGSTRGTFVNGQKINKAKLADGDQIQVGDVRLELAMLAAAAPGVAAPDAAAAVVVAAPQPPSLGAGQSALPVARPTVPAPVVMATQSFVTPAPVAPMHLEEPGARAVEVATMLGDSVVDVKHCMDPRGGKVTPKTWGFVAGGLACLLASASAFYISVDNAATNRASLAYHTEVLKKPAYSHRPNQLGAGVDWVAFGGLALGLFGMTAGLLRARGERKSPYYRIGTAAGVEQAIEGAPAPAFPMVAPSGDDFVFNYGVGMDGELIVDGKATPLAELAATGRARPSAAVAGAIEVPIPSSGKIRARAGQTTFLVTPMAKPRAQSTPLFHMERRTAAYVGGSLAIHMGIIAFLQTIPPDDSSINFDLGSVEATSISTATTVTDDVPPEPEQDTGDTGGGESLGGRMALDEGEAGRPDAPNNKGRLAVKDRGEQKQMSREQAIEEARNAGILGSVQQIRGGIAVIGGTADWASGIDDADFYGPLFGGQGEGRGNWGMGVHGWGPGGGCYGTDCGGVGVGDYKTIGGGNKAGDEYGIGGPGKGGWRKRTGQAPVAIIPMPTAVTDGLDKAIIKRYVKRNLAKISFCYESALLANPGLDGTVNVQFLISANGTVSTSKGGGMDSKVANCVADVVKNIEFPAPSNGGSVQVNYPFTFRAAGSQ